jgi:hypothetical protein
MSQYPSNYSLITNVKTGLKSLNIQHRDVTGLTLLRYHENSYVNSTIPWGQCDPIKKIIPQFITIIFFSKYYFTTRFVLKYRQTDTTLLRSFRIYGSNREIYKKWITKSEEYSTKFHV